MSTTPSYTSAPNGSARRFGGVFLPTVIVLAVLLFALSITANLWTEVKWFAQLGAVRVFWTQWGWAIALGAIGSALVAVSVAVNLSVAKPKSEVIEEGHSGVSNYRSLVDDHKWMSRLIIPLIIGLIFGAPLAGEWRTYVMWLFRTPFGTTDPEFGYDVSFYVFSLPLLHSILSFAIMALVIGAIAAVMGHYVYGGFGMSQGRMSLTRRARIHMAVLGAIGALLVSFHYFLARFDMLLKAGEKFDGANYTDINASLPGRTVLAIVALLVAILFVYAAVRGNWKFAGVGIAVGVVTSLVATWAYPALLQTFRVTPNAVEMESEFIQRNINATLTAYGLDDIETTNYAAHTEAEPGQLREDAEATAQIRLLDPTIVSPTFNQLQQNRQYYQFAQNLSVDRYNIDDTDRDTVIAVRELNLNGLDASQRTWVNDHTVYTHGYGVAAAYGNTTNNRGAPSFFQRGIPSVGELGEYEPRVYFGQSSPEYSIVGSDNKDEQWEIDYPDDSAATGQVYTTYSGDGGPKLSNAWEKLMFAIKFGSTDMFFSDRVNSESQILYDRDPHQRVSKVAPYLTLDTKAYPAVVDMDGNPDTPKRLVWIIDAYTTSNNYPYSARAQLSQATNDALSNGLQTYSRGDEVNYIRNSVKAVVDAYDGSVTLYKWDDQDPILKAWDSVFPGLITDVSEMSGDLMSHVRYPEDLFKVQRTLLTRYHVTDAASFYSGGDFWHVPNEPTAGDATGVSSSTEQQPPYYLTLQMPRQDSAEFSLSTGFVPGGTTKRNVMTGFLAADSNAGDEAGKVREGYGKLRLLELPRDDTVPGPGQAQNNFLTDSTVSRALNLLRSGGTKVEMGNLLTLPVGGGLLYVQPVYISASSGTQFPLMQYVLTSFGDGNPIGFAPTLEESLNMTFGGDSGAEAGDKNVHKDDDVITPDGGVIDPGTNPTAEPTDVPSVDPTEQPTDAPVVIPGSPKERLNTALSDMQAAIKKADDARTSGDWAAYGEAQKALSEALDRAVKAQEELDQ